MSVILDQLRISEDGQAMFIDAHVNKACYFDGVYIHKITICTEDQVSEVNPYTYQQDFVYQEEVQPCTPIKEVYDKVQILTAEKLLEAKNESGGWNVSYTKEEDAELYCLSLVLSGKFSVFDTGYAPRLVVTSNAFNPNTDNMNNDEILFYVDGTPYEDKGHAVWQFKGKGEVATNTPLCFYLYKQESEGNYTFVSLDATDDKNFLHFLWQIYGLAPKLDRKELHLVLNRFNFNEKFQKSDLSHNMFFVYIECAGIPSPDTPCMFDEMTTVGVTYDYDIFYNQAMNYTRELVEECTVPQKFLDFILNVEALKLSIETEHYVPAIRYWEHLLGNTYSNKTTKPCGCHG